MTRQNCEVLLRLHREMAVDYLQISFTGLLHLGHDAAELRGSITLAS